MAFQIKDFVSIVASILNHARGATSKITDLQPGSVARTIMESPAVEIEELYLQIFNGLREAIPVATFKSFGFDKLPAKFARGFVTIKAAAAPTANSVVAAGTVFTAEDGRQYLSSEAVAWLAGAVSVRVPIIAAAAGISYNISAGSINASPAYDSSYTISNAAISNGSDVESDTEREARFADYIASLSGGTTVACAYAAGKATLLDADGNITEYVTRTGLSEIAGSVTIYIYSSAGLPSRELVTKAQTLIDGYKDPDTAKITPGYRAGGVRVEVVSMVERAVPLNARVSLFAGYTLNDAMKQLIADSFATLLTTVSPGGILYADDIETAVLRVPGVKSVVIDTTENIQCGASQALVSGTVTVTAL